MNKVYTLSIRCYFPGTGNYTHHMQDMPLKDIAKWVNAYQFTHPNVENISIKIYLDRKETQKYEIDKL